MAMRDPSPIASLSREDVLDWLENRGRAEPEVAYVLSAVMAVAVAIAAAWRWRPGGWW